MRKMTCILLIYLMTLTFIPTALATMSINTLSQQQSLDMAKEKSEVQQAVNKFKPKEFLVDKKKDLELKQLDDIQSINQLEYGKAYKVVIADKKVIQSLLDGTNLSIILAKTSYQWEYPILAKENNSSIASFTVAYFDNKWQVAEVGGYLSPEQSSFSSIPTDFISLLKDHSLDQANSFFHFRIPSLHTDFLYIEAADQEYFIPLIHSRDDLYGLKNKTIYTRDELISAIGPTIKENINNPNPAPTGYPSTKNNKINYIFYALVFMVIAFLGYKRLSKRFI